MVNRAGLCRRRLCIWASDRLHRLSIREVADLVAGLPVAAPSTLHKRAAGPVELPTFPMGVAS